MNLEYTGYLLNAAMDVIEAVLNDEQSPLTKEQKDTLKTASNKIFSVANPDD